MRTFAIAAAVLMAGCVGVQAHDHLGPHFHADMGIAGSTTSAEYLGDSQKLSGAGGAFSIAAGGAVAPNVILGGELWGTAVSEPTLTVNGDSGTIPDTTYGVIGMGPTIKYYVMPANVFFSATPSVTRMTFSDDNSDGAYRTEWGFGLRTSIGKEWQVAGGWGLGVAGVLDYASNKDQDVDANWTTWGGGVVFSASFN